MYTCATAYQYTCYLADVPACGRTYTPMTTRIITVTNNKGGVGKTTTVVNLAAGLGLEGRRVLVVDADPQANTTFALLGPTAPAVTLYDSLVTNSVPLSRTITPIKTRGVDLVPSH